MKKIDLKGIMATRRTGNSHKWKYQSKKKIKRNKTGSMVTIYQKIYTNRI